jgi:hypothetical protein
MLYTIVSAVMDNADLETERHVVFPEKYAYPGNSSLIGHSVLERRHNTVMLALDRSSCLYVHVYHRSALFQPRKEGQAFLKYRCALYVIASRVGKCRITEEVIPDQTVVLAGCGLEATLLLYIRKC